MSVESVCSGFDSDNSIDIETLTIGNILVDRENIENDDAKVQTDRYQVDKS